MNKERRLAVVAVTRLLNDLEASLDASLIKGSELTAGMLESRINSKLAASVGQEALAKVVEAISDLSQARSKIVEAHGMLANIRSELGLQVFAAGDLGKLLEPKGMANDAEPIAGSCETELKASA